MALTTDRLVTFDPSLTGIIVLTQGEIDIDDTLTIQGPGAGVITVSGNNASRIFNIDNEVFFMAVAVEISGLTLTGGNGNEGDVGGAIYTLEGLTLRNTVLTGNQASSGGAIYAYAGSVTVIDSTLTENQASGSGGAIYADSEGFPVRVTIQGSTLSRNTAGGSGGAIGTEGESNPNTLQIENSVLSDNTAGGAGGAIFTTRADVAILDSTLSGNTAQTAGGGAAYFVGGGEVSRTLRIERTTIANNQAVYAGGIAAFSGDVIVTHSTISGNQATRDGGFQGGGGAAFLSNTTTTIENSTIAYNSAIAESNGGGALVLSNNDSATIRNTTIANNTVTGGLGGGIFAIDDFGPPTVLTLISTIVANNTDMNGANDIVNDDSAAITINASNSLFSTTPTTGAGNTINGTNTANIFGTDPLLGPLQDNGGPTQTMALGAGSAARNTGSNPDNLAFDQRGPGFARTVDGLTDIGAFQTQATPPPPPPPVGPTFFVVGAGSGSSLIQVRDAATGEVLSTQSPWGNYPGGVRVAVGDIDGDGVADVIAAAGPGGGAEIKVYSGKDGALVRNFFVYDLGTFTGGLFVAAGDVDRDGAADIIVGADAGAGAEVKVYSGRTGALIHDFYAWALGTFTGGVRVAAGDVDGDGFMDIVCGAGPGALPEVKVYSGRTGAVILNFFAFGNFSGGVYVAAGDLTGDGKADIITGAGAGGGPQVAIFNGANAGILASYFAVLPSLNFTGGVRVGYSPTVGTGHGAVLAAAGPGNLAEVHAFDGLTNQAVLDFFAYGPQAFSGGLFIGG